MMNTNAHEIRVRAVLSSKPKPLKIVRPRHSCRRRRRRRPTTERFKVLLYLAIIAIDIMIKSFSVCAYQYAYVNGYVPSNYRQKIRQGSTRMMVQSVPCLRCFTDHGSSSSSLSGRTSSSGICSGTSSTSGNHPMNTNMNMFGWHRHRPSSYRHSRLLLGREYLNNFPCQSIIRTTHNTNCSNFRTFSQLKIPLLKSAAMDEDIGVQEEEEEEKWEEEDATTTTSSSFSSSYDVILDGLNDAQVEAVTQPLESVTRVVAGPGAGKTRVLTCRIAYLLKRDDEEDEDVHGVGRRNSRILAVTFTKKAASEMQHRLESLLQDDEDYQNKLSSSEQQQGQGRNARIDDGSNFGDEIYEEVVRQDTSNGGISTSLASSSSSMITRVSLGTFHSICSKILRWNGSELAALPSVQQYSSKDSNGDAASLDGSFAIVDQSEQMRIIKQCLKDCGLDLKGSNGGGRGQADIRPITILNAVGQLKSDDAMEVDSRPTAGESQDTSSSTGGIKMTSKVRRIAEEVYPIYRKTLISQNSLDFDDLILLTRELLKTNEEVRERMSKRWQHVLVDEFQDTSEVQLDLVRLLTTTSLMVVGDGDQSIYSWRGAHAESMADFVRKFDKAGEKNVDTVYLMENYRSTTNIVKAAQKVINDTTSSSSSNAAIRKDMKPMRGTGPSPRILACADSKAEATFVVNEVKKMEESGLLNSRSTIALIYRTNAQSRALEEACVAGNLKYLVRGSAGTFYSRAEIKDCLCFLRWLYNGRDRSAMIRAMKTPSRGLGDVSLNEFSSYCEEVGRHVVQNDPNGPQPTPLDILISLGKTAGEEGDDRSYLPADGVITKRTMNKLLPFAMQMNRLSRKAQSQTVAELLKTIIDVMGLKTHFDAISKTSDEFADRWANVMELLSASERYTKDGACMETKKVEIDGEQQMEEMSPLGNFLDDVSLLTETEQQNEDESEGRMLANLMTIHASKGMEFDAVFLVGNEESTFPTQRAITEGEGSVELAEERRLCYVAMTRAKTHLIMTWRKEVLTFFGQGFKVNKTDRSRFLDALVSKKTLKKKAKKKSITGTRSGARGEESDMLNSPSLSRPRMGQKTLKRRVRPQRDTDPLRPRPPTRAKVKSQVRRAGPVTAAGRAAMERDAAKNMLRKKAEDRRQKEIFAKYENKPPKYAPAVRARPRPRPAVGDDTGGRRQKSTVAKKRKATRRQNNEREFTSSAPPEMDSTMFYAVGTGVNHFIHGEGKVIQPPPSMDKSDSMLVYVKFDSGMTMDFPVGSSGLTIKY